MSGITCEERWIHCPLESSVPSSLEITVCPCGNWIYSKLYIFHSSETTSLRNIADKCIPKRVPPSPARKSSLCRRGRLHDIVNQSCLTVSCLLCKKKNQCPLSVHEYSSVELVSPNSPTVMAVAIRSMMVTETRGSSLPSSAKLIMANVVR